MGKDNKLTQIFDSFETKVRISDGRDCADGIPIKQNIYFGCNYEDIPTVTIEWSEKGRGFGEYSFQIKDGKMICYNECDSKETVKRILCIMVDQCEFIDGE